MTAELVFVKKFVAFGTGIGLPRSVAKVLGWLIICKPQEQSSDQVQQQVSLSAGSVSTALAMLVDMQLVERIKLPGQRKPYYRLVPNGFIKSVERRFETFKMAEQIADAGLEIAPGDDRLIAMKQLYSFLDREMQEVAKRLDKLT